ncbi:hypothetical protein M422DRAFT_269340 [Sphaerobolus stellatus SS14]|uniref:F-box domain-containing protein n=1 Tax=Sphaerobolus stellatus (strain SS14) TaxID=990650 RepID=A0A0C9UK57_SPHS4|nr:hypothetical protein M422DRAFT_269340 [Sphaerobolus stellatus SS14]
MLRSLSSFAVELREYIVEGIDDVGDLLSLALTSRAFCALVIPWHIEYRWICCSPARKEIWSILSRKPSLAARLRNLELIDEVEGEVFIPRSLEDFPEYMDMPEYVERREFDHPRVPVPPLPVDVGPRLLTLLEHTDLTRFFCDRLLVGTAVFSLLSKIIKHSPELQELHIMICYSATHIRSLNSNVLNPNVSDFFS